MNHFLKELIAIVEGPVGIDKEGFVMMRSIEYEALLKRFPLISTLMKNGTEPSNNLLWIIVILIAH
jgi:hypothetical protein